MVSSLEAIGANRRTISPDEQADLDNRFSYHKPDEKTARTHGFVREVFGLTAEDIVSLVPNSRERALALTHLEQAMFWTNAAVARIGVDGERL